MGEQYNFHAEAEDLLQRAMRSFAAWLAGNWTITAQEAETLTKPTTAPSEYARGYNDALSAVSDALETWLENGAMIDG